MSAVVVSYIEFHPNLFDLPEILLVQIISYLTWIDVIHLESVSRTLRTILFKNFSSIEYPMSLSISMTTGKNDEAQILLETDARIFPPVKYFTIVQNSLEWLAAKVRCSFSEGKENFFIGGLPASRENGGVIVIFARSNLKDAIMSVTSAILKKFVVFSELTLDNVPRSFYASVLQALEYNPIDRLKTLALVTQEKRFENDVIDFLDRLNVQNFMLTTAQPLRLSNYFAARLFEYPFTELKITNASFDIEEYQWQNSLPRRLYAPEGVGFRLSFFSKWMEAAVKNDKFDLLRIKLDGNIDEIRGYMRKFLVGIHGRNTSIYDILLPRKLFLCVQISSKERGITEVEVSQR